MAETELPTQAQARAQDEFRVLVFSRTTPSGYRHASIEAGIDGIKRLAGQVSRSGSGKEGPLEGPKLVPFTVEATEDSSVFDRLSRLERYRVIVLLSNSGDDCLDEGKLGNFRQWVGLDGGVVGVHCASFCCRARDMQPKGEIDCSGKNGNACDGGQDGRVWYGDLIGGVFADHPVPQDGVVQVIAEGIAGTIGPEGSKAIPETLTGGVDKIEGRGSGGGAGHVKGQVDTGMKEAPSHLIHIAGQIGIEYLIEMGWGTSGSSGNVAGTKMDNDKGDDHMKDHESQGTIDESERRNANHAADKDKNDQDSRSKDLRVGTRLRWHDEWYNFVSHPREKLLESHSQGKIANFTVLLTVDESTYSGGKHGRDHPVAWCQEFKTGGGRCFYTSLGHFDEAYEDPWFMGHLLGGIYWAAKIC